MNPSLENISSCAEAIRRGELVVVPTETVYGLAANALDPAAVQKIFDAKGRPSWNPLIVHVSGLEMAETVGDMAKARGLVEAFWPGPLSIVVPSKGIVASGVTAGGSTVAVRQPRHPVLAELIREAGVPLAAPSANLFTQLSPTRAENVDQAIVARAFAILDGGPCEVGIESTVVDVTEDIPTILRLGDVSFEQLREVCGEVALGERKGDVRSPGQHPRHYAPKNPLLFVSEAELEVAITDKGISRDRVIRVSDDSKAYAKGLFALLAELDKSVGPIVIVRPPTAPEWAAVWDRLNRAASASDEP